MGEYDAQKKTLPAQDNNWSLDIRYICRQSKISQLMSWDQWDLWDIGSWDGSIRVCRRSGLIGQGSSFVPGDDCNRNGDQWEACKTHIAGSLIKTSNSHRKGINMKRIKHNDLTHYFLRPHEDLPAAYLASCEKFFKSIKQQASSGKPQASSLTNK